MFTLLYIFQTDPTTAGSASDLTKLNSYGFAFVIIGIMLMLLIVAHWYRMQAKIEKKKKAGERQANLGISAGDMTSQLEFMSRDELKEMVLRERADEAARSAQKGTDDLQDVTAGETPPQATSTPQEPLLFGDDDIAVVNSETQIDGVTDLPGLKNEDSEISSEDLARLVTPDDIESEIPPEKPAKPAGPVKNPYTDKVERAPLSSDLPDEFKNKSRKI